jgi:protein-S-isoprenylcysteine O-methyltransferase Ste14
LYSGAVAFTMPSMIHAAHVAAAIAWTLFWLYWIASSLRTKASQRREPGGTFLLRVGLLLVAASVWNAGGPMLLARFVPLSAGVALGGLALVLAGLLFAIWARLHLGRNWSGTVTLKEGHELVRSGPYALVRHPIYTGLLAALLGSAVMKGEVRSLVALALIGVALLVKMRLEERWMVERFGEEYERYRREVKGLIPFVV